MGKFWRKATPLSGIEAEGMTSVPHVALGLEEIWLRKKGQAVLFGFNRCIGFFGRGDDVSFPEYLAQHAVASTATLESGCTCHIP
jgi:hypothetical protein